MPPVNLCPHVHLLLGNTDLAEPEQDPLLCPTIIHHKIVIVTLRVQIIHNSKITSHQLHNDNLQFYITIIGSTLF